MCETLLLRSAVKIKKLYVCVWESTCVLEWIENVCEVGMFGFRWVLLDVELRFWIRLLCCKSVFFGINYYNGLIWSLIETRLSLIKEIAYILYNIFVKWCFLKIRCDLLVKIAPVQFYYWVVLSVHFLNLYQCFFFNLQ